MSTAPRVTEAIRQIESGGAVLVVDGEDHEKPGDLAMAAEAATPEAVAFFLRHASGPVCVALTDERAGTLGLHPMVDRYGEAHDSHTASVAAVDLAGGVTTGISAEGQSATISRLAAADAVARDFVRPGHVLPLRTRRGGVLGRAGYSEAASDLAHLAGLGATGVLCDVRSSDHCATAGASELRGFAGRHRLPMITIRDLVQHRLRSECLVDHVAQARVPTAHGEFTCHAWRSTIDGVEHLAFVHGDVSGADPVLVRVHSECLTGDVFGSRRCDCGSQLDDAMDAIVREGRGIVVYLRGQEGRGIGITNKLLAYNLQDSGRDTVDANLELHLPVDTREYGIGAQILTQLGVQRLRLMSNNPDKFRGLAGYGIEILDRVALPLRPTPDNIAYLRTKRNRMGHLLPDALAEEQMTAGPAFAAARRGHAPERFGDGPGWGAGGAAHPARAKTVE